MIEGLLSNDPGLASVRIVGERGGSSTALHLVADWPGYFPHGPQIAKLLIDGGADIEAPDGSIGTPLDNAVGYACGANVASVLACLRRRAASRC